METLNFAIVGGGYISEYHIRAIQGIPGTHIRTIASRDPAKVRPLAEKYGIPGTCRFEDLAGDHHLQAVVIATPNRFHAPYATASLIQGLDVFLEKPMAMNYNECCKIEEVARAAGRIVMVGHMWRFDEEVNTVRKLVKQGDLGKIIKSKAYGIHQNWGPSGWFTSKALAGGGALIDMGVHAIDTVRYILGDPEPVRVYANISTSFGDYNVDDNGILMITWSDHTISMIESGWWQPHMEGPEAATRIYGTLGYASVFPTTARIKTAEGFRELSLPVTERTEHCDQSIYDRQMQQFVACIRNRQQPSPGIEEGKIIMKIVDAAYQSAEQGKAIDLN